MNKSGNDQTEIYLKFCCMYPKVYNFTEREP